MSAISSNFEDVIDSWERIQKLILCLSVFSHHPFIDSDNLSTANIFVRTNTPASHPAAAPFYQPEPGLPFSSILYVQNRRNVLFARQIHVGTLLRCFCCRCCFFIVATFILFSSLSICLHFFLDWWKIQFGSFVFRLFRQCGTRTRTYILNRRTGLLVSTMLSRGLTGF